MTENGSGAGTYFVDLIVRSAYLPPLVVFGSFLNCIKVGAKTLFLLNINKLELKKMPKDTIG